MNITTTKNPNTKKYEIVNYANNEIVQTGYETEHDAYEYATNFGFCILTRTAE